MAENKTKPTAISVDDFLAAIDDPAKRADALRLRDMMARLSGQPATMWGPSIIGFGSYRYAYESGRSGEAPRIGFSPRAKEFALYLLGTVSRGVPLLDELGRHRTGKGCLYVKRLADVDESVLEALIAESLAYSREAYPQGA